MWTPVCPLPFSSSKLTIFTTKMAAATVTDLAAYVGQQEVNITVVVSDKEREEEELESVVCE